MQSILSPMTARTRDRLAMGMKAAAVALCVVFAMRGRPPAGAQSSHAMAFPVLTIKDAQQDDAITTLRDNAERSERSLDQLNERMSVLSDDVAGLKGENRAEFGGIALIGGGGMLLGRRKKREEEA